MEWIEEVRAAQEPEPASVMFVTVDGSGRPSARTVTLKRIEDDEPIEDLAPLRDRLAHLHRVAEAPPACPPDWGAVRVVPDFAEFWTGSPDRLHDRLSHVRDADGGWRQTRVAP